MHSTARQHSPPVAAGPAAWAHSSQQCSAVHQGLMRDSRHQLRERRRLLRSPLRLRRFRLPPSS